MADREITGRVFWVAYSPDPARFELSIVAFTTELPALRHAVKNDLRAAKVLFGQNLRDQLLERPAEVPE